jgi:hypothetical protein
MKKMMKIAAVLLSLVALLTSAIGIAKTEEPTPKIEYAVERIEIGAEGEQWVVLEVYDPISDTIDHLDIKVEEGYKVAY